MDTKLTRPLIAWLGIAVGALIAIVIALGRGGEQVERRYTRFIMSPEHSLPREANDAYTPRDQYCISAGYEYLVHFNDLPACAVFFIDEQGLASKLVLLNASAIRARQASANEHRLTPQQYRAAMLQKKRT
jgi:hypothetical protein